MRQPDWAEKLLLYNSSECQFFGRKCPACAKCVEACPQEALKKGEEIIEIDPERCDDCGDCVSICPSGALGLKIENRQPIRQLLEGLDGSVLVLCDERSWNDVVQPDRTGQKPLPPGVEVAQVPNIGVLTEADFAEALMISRRGIVVLAPEERDRERPFVRAAELVGEISTQFFSRRLVRVLADMDAVKSRIKEMAAFPECSLVPRVFPSGGSGKREALRLVLSEWMKAAGPGVSDVIVIRHPSYATITCESERCILCGACANQCKVKSLVLDSNKERLTRLGIACLNCGACVALCPEDALAAEPGLCLLPTFLSPQEIARSEGLRCAECGRHFTSAKRARKVAEKLQAARGEDPIRQELLTLCPECRTKRAFTTYADWTKAR